MTILQHAHEGCIIWFTIDASTKVKIIKNQFYDLIPCFVILCVHFIMCVATVEKIKE